MIQNVGSASPVSQDYAHIILSLSPKMYVLKIANIALLASAVAAHFVVPNDDQDMSGVVVNGIPYSTRVKYMRLVNPVLFPFSMISKLIVTRPMKLSLSRAVHVHSLLMAQSS